MSSFFPNSVTGQPSIPQESFFDDEPSQPSFDREPSTSHFFSEETSVDDENDHENEDNKDDTSLIRQMMRYWVNEKMAPELLESKGDEVDALMDLVNRQVGFRMKLSEREIDQSVSQAEAVEKVSKDDRTDSKEHFKLILVQTEMQRVKYLIRSYIRTRLNKVGLCFQGICLATLDNASSCSKHRSSNFINTSFLMRTQNPE
jgi:hypothetical protein